VVQASALGGKRSGYAEAYLLQETSSCDYSLHPSPQSLRQCMTMLRERDGGGSRECTGHAS
jgi:hypothetical protein